MAATLQTGAASPGVVVVKRTFLDLADTTTCIDQEHWTCRMRRANSDSMLLAKSDVLSRSRANSELGFEDDKVADLSDAETVDGDTQQAGSEFLQDSTSNSELECRSMSSGSGEGGFEELLVQAVSEHGRLAREHRELWQHMEDDHGADALVDVDGLQMAMAMDQSGGWWQMPSGQACYFVPVDAASLGMSEQCFQYSYPSDAPGDESRRPRGRRARAARAAARRVATAAQEAASHHLGAEAWMDEPAEVVDFPANRYATAPGGAILPAPVKQRSRQASAGPRTTVMLRNMPNNYNRSMLLELLDQEGFTAQYDFLYLPIDFQSRASLGYAFINLQDEATALRFFRTFDGYSNWIIPSRKVSGVSWAGPHQGLRANVERYRNSPVMARSVPDEYKPVVFESGVRAAFPIPTRRIKAPQA